jgi:hypothetical protein
MKRDQAERNDDQEDRFLVYMPAEEERRVPTERDCANKGFPGGFVEQSKEDRLYTSALSTPGSKDELTICAPRVKRKHVRGTTSGRTAKDVSPTKPLVTLFTASGSTFSPRRGAAVKVSKVL